MSEDLLKQAADWWSTDIIDVRPGEILIRGYGIEDLIGRVSFPAIIWLTLKGELPSQAQATLLEAALVASIDHGPHAPSIAIASMAATCGIGLNNAVATAVNVLGDVHGGAGQDCMKMYQIVHKEKASHIDVAVKAVLDRLYSATYVPGFGHRFHKVDPRSTRILQLLDDAVTKGTIKGDYVAIGKAVERTLSSRKGKPIPMNIDGVTAVVFSELGFEPELGRGLFVLSRSVGILAHAWEQMSKGKRMQGPMPKEIPFTYTGPARRPLPKT